MSKEKKIRRHIPGQAMLQLPLLDAIADAGGRLRPGEAYERIAERLGISENAQNLNQTYADGKTYNVYHQQVRWTRQTAVAQQFIATDTRGIWALTDKGYGALGKAKSGTIALIYSLDDGIALWASAETAATVIEPGIVKLILCSPPYPAKTRSYGRMEVPEWLDWMSKLTALWKDLIADDGTIAVNLMDTFIPGTPALDPYIERFTLDAIDTHGLCLADRMIWHAPNKLANIQWTLKTRERPRNTLEHILLFSKTPMPDWNIDRVEVSPPNRNRKVDSRTTPSTRPSGYLIDPARFSNTSRPVPDNLIKAGPAPGNDRYSRRCRESGTIPHPARFPESLPKRIIGLTTRPLDICYDPMAGSNTTGKVALDMGRRFIASEAMLDYVRSSAFRFDHRPDFAPRDKRS